MDKLHSYDYVSCALHVCVIQVTISIIATIDTPSLSWTKKAAQLRLPCPEIRGLRGPPLKVYTPG